MRPRPSGPRRGPHPARLRPCEGRAGPSAGSGTPGQAGVRRPIDEQHIAEPGLVVLDIDGGDEDTVRPPRQEPPRTWKLPPVHVSALPLDPCGER
ncbi:DUF6207 family protein [Streptomyces sp. NPDC012888]|uniref:DUF6207 family protein n=1 Tax=Streptomyces sp. NPDC012888 TaxID=3364855 RepID=UPI0036C0DD7D